MLTKKYMPKITSYAVALLLFTSSIYSQVTITIGNGTGSGTSSPIASWYNSSATESIYTGTEIGTTGNITKIGYTKASGSSTTNPSVKVYMKTTSAADLGTASYAIGSQNFSNYTLVFDGQLPNTASTGLMEITLTTPFSFTSTAQNLSVLIVGTTCISSGRPQFRYTTTATRMSAGHNDGSIGCGGSSSFTFNSSFSPVLERPNLTMTLAALSTPDFQNQNEIAVAVHGNTLEAASPTNKIKSILVFDITGRRIAASDFNSNTAIMDVNLAKQMAIVKIITENNLEITKKIIL